MYYYFFIISFLFNTNINKNILNKDINNAKFTKFITSYPIVHDKYNN